MSAGAEVYDLQTRRPIRARPRLDLAHVRQHLQLQAVPGTLVSLSALFAGNRWEHMHLATVDDAVDQVVTLDSAGAEGIYLRSCPMTTDPGPGRRGGGADAAVVSALWLDIDVRGGAGSGHQHDPAKHGGLMLPLDDEDALRLLVAVGLPPVSYVVLSGGGVNPHWRFSEPVWLDDDTRALVTDLMRRLEAVVARAFAAVGRFYGVGVAEPGRIMRLAGTINAKPTRDTPARAEVCDLGRTVTLAEFQNGLETAEALWPAPAPIPSTTTASASAASTEPVDDVSLFLFAGGAGVPLNLAGLLTELLTPVMVQLLEFYGWTYVGTEAGGAVLLRRPGNPAHPVSAKWFGAAGAPVLVVHSSETELPAGADQKLTPPKVLAYLAGFHGDLSAFSKALQPALQGIPAADTFGIPEPVMAELRNRYVQNRPVPVVPAAPATTTATASPSTVRTETPSIVTHDETPTDDMAAQNRERLLADATREAYLRQRATNAARDLIRTEDEHAAGVSPESWGAEAGTLTDLADLPGEPPARITGLLPAGGRVTLVAARKSGKTTAMLNMARCLLTGEAFLGQFPVRVLGPGERVGFVNLEVSRQQFSRWAREHDVPADRVWVANLRGRPNPLATAAGRAWLMEQLRAHRCTVLILDTFGRAFTGENQDSNSEVTRFLAGVIDPLLAEAGVGEFLMTVHTGWSSERSRGASALEDWPDALWRMTRPGKDPKDGDDEQDAGQRFFSAEGRDVDVPEDALAYDPDTRTLTLSGAGNRREARENRRAAELLEDLVPLIREQPGIHQRALVAEYRASLEGGKGFASGDVKVALSLGVSTGRLSVSDGPNRRQCYSVIRL